jgi:Fur family transcriptional regulator, ferric uptake regulator
MELQTLMRKFESHLSRNGLRATVQRRLVLNAAELLAPDHFGVHDILESVSETSKTLKLGRATVYRTLEQLVDAGILRKLQLDSGAAVFELIEGDVHHEHLICEVCGEVIEFESPEIERLQDEICERLDFVPKNHILRITGVCAKCR